MMDLTHIVLLSVLVLISAFSIYLYFRNNYLDKRGRHLYCECEDLKEKLKQIKENPPKALTADSKELLAMLLNDHRAIVRCDVLDPGDFFIRVPR